MTLTDKNRSKLDIIRERDNALQALHVLLLTPAIRDWLAVNDPKALEQAKGAIPVHTLTLEQASAYGEAFFRKRFPSLSS